MTLRQLATLWREGRRFFVMLVLARVLIAATWIVQAFATAQIFSMVLNADTEPGYEAALVGSVTVLVAALVARPLFTMLGHVIAHRAMTWVKSDLRVRAIRALVRRSARDSRGRSGGDHALVSDGIENLDAYLSAYLPQWVTTVATVTTVSAVMIAIDPIAGIVAAAVAACVPVLPRLWSRLLARRGASQWEAYQQLHAEFVDSMNGMTTLVAFGADERRQRHLAQASGALLARTISQLRLSLVDSGLAAVALIGAPALVLMVLAVRDEPPAAVTLFTLVLLSIEVVRPLRELAALWHAGYVGTFSGAAVAELLAGELTEDAPACRVEAAPVRAIEVRGLSIHYADSTEPSLTVSSLVIEPGMTAIVGPTGAGKSTLAAALVGLAVPHQGAVALDGVEQSADELLARVSLVPQDPVLEGGTVREEIARAVPTHRRELTESIVEESARVAGIGSDDRALTLDSPVGEAGGLVSGGQRQRIAVARALAQGRSVLVLDESTSALDAASEAQLVARLRADRDRVLVAVTHREAVVALADTVITVANGEVVDTLRVSASEPRS